MSDGSWDVVKLVLSATFGGAIAMVLQRALPALALTTALRADARGAVTMVGVLLPELRATVTAANRLLRTVGAGHYPSFDEITALRDGWVITPPSIDLLGHAQRFGQEERAYAVMKYLHYWNLMISQEQRYRAALDHLLRELGAVDTTQERFPLLLLREYATRVRDNAVSLRDAAAQLSAQARCFRADDFVALDQDAEAKAKRGALGAD